MPTLQSRIVSLFLVALSPIATESAFAQSKIHRDEMIIFFPSAASASLDGTVWQLPIHGWVFEPESDSLKRRTLVRTAQFGFGNLEDGESAELLRRRLSRFLVDNERNKRIVVRSGEQSLELNPSDADGHFEGQFKLSTETVARLRRGSRLEFQAVLPEGDDRQFLGHVHLLDPQGILVVSDIDDTVKVTEVRNKRQAIRNSLLRPFIPIAGMAELYREWEQCGADFHFVSGSPWQLYPDLAEFFQQQNFPPAAVNLRRMRFKDPQIIEVLENSEAFKLGAIRQLLESHAGRSLVLVGDSGERDPEIYGQIAREYPERVRRILIRNVSDESADAPRYRDAFQEVPPERWEVFDRVEEIRNRRLEVRGGEPPAKR